MKNVTQGAWQKTTMTVGELREKLSDYPDDMPVLATWETIYTEFTPDNFFVTTEQNSILSEQCLIIDVDQY